MREKVKGPEVEPEWLKEMREAIELLKNADEQAEYKRLAKEILDMFKEK